MPGTKSNYRTLAYGEGCSPLFPSLGAGEGEDGGTPYVGVDWTLKMPLYKAGEGGAWCASPSGGWFTKSALMQRL